MNITTKDYGFIAYLMLKYVTTKSDDGVLVETDKDEVTLIKEYNISSYSTYNEILRKVVRG